jgi:hypothetical protein
MTESKLQRAILKEFNQGPTRLFRNNVGKLQDKNGRWVAFGLCKGSADLIGIHKGRLLSIEVKEATGQAKDHQEAWRAMVVRLGGIAGVVRSLDEVRRLLSEADGSPG